MKKIAVITQATKLNDEKGYTRLTYIAELLAKEGFDVELITSTFQHWEKKQRNNEVTNYADKSYRVKFIYEPGYKKNIDLRRFWSHYVLAWNLRKYLKSHGEYDLIYFEIPPNNVAREIVRYAVNKKIPTIADVNDLWPEAMRMVMDIPVISNILFYPIYKDAEWVYSHINAVVGTSEEYAARPGQYNHRSIEKKVVYVGNDIDEFDAGVREYSNQIIKKENEFWVMYAGTIGTSYDVKTLILAATLLKKKGYKNIHVKILGDGPLREGLEILSRERDCNVEFLGYIPYKKMAAYLSKADILVNSFVKKAPQSIVTKIGDYLAAGKPMINTCSSPEFRRKVENDGFGINIEAENEKLLAENILYLYGNSEWRKRAGSKARIIAEEEFDRKKAYRKILELVNSLLRNASTDIAVLNCDNNGRR